MNHHSGIKSLPASERPYERGLAFGPSALSNAELLAIILRSGTKEQSSLALAEELLRHFGGERGVTFLADCTPEELQRLGGIGPVKALTLSAVGELSRRIAKTQREAQVTLSSPSSIASYFMEEMRHLGHEELRLVCLNTKNKLLHQEVISVGTVNASLASPREIFLTALRRRAAGFILLHNHPSGDPTPSREDILLTKKLSESGQMLEIPLLDHIVIGDRRYYSMKEEGYL